MLTSIELHNYRGFRRFRLEGLKRVTLLVGENNTGKTSILEAAKILAYGTSPISLTEIMRRRGERLPGLANEQAVARMDPAHFFHGHTTEAGSSFGVRGETAGTFGVDVSIEKLAHEIGGAYTDVDLDPYGEGASDSSEDSLSEGIFSPPRALVMRGHNNDTRMSVPLDLDGGFSLATVRRAAAAGTNLYPIPECFIPTAGMSVSDMTRYWNQLQHDRKETEIVEALRLIEPGVEDLRHQSVESPGTVQRATNAGFFVGLEGVSSLMPLGSLGDGMTRLLALTLASRQVRAGYLLVDDIDTGLHYTVMPKMWRLIIENARRFNVQVLAATHSLDCVRSLALLYEESPDLVEEVALHRLEKGFDISIPFTPKELAIGARQQMEFR